MTEVSRHCTELIAQRADPWTVESMIAAQVIDESVRARIVSHEMQRWRSWTFVAGRMDTDLDEKIGRFVINAQENESFKGTNSKERKILKRRSLQLGLKYDREGQTVVLTKPEKNWKAELDKVKPHTVDELMKWSSDCAMCQTKVDAWSAMYHWCGTGPLCMICVWKDPIFSGGGWQSYATRQLRL
jgi:hypothetical protein